MLSAERRLAAKGRPTFLPPVAKGRSCLVPSLAVLLSGRSVIANGSNHLLPADAALLRVRSLIVSPQVIWLTIKAAGKQMVGTLNIGPAIKARIRSIGAPAHMLGWSPRTFPILTMLQTAS